MRILAMKRLIPICVFLGLMIYVPGKARGSFHCAPHKATSYLLTIKDEEYTRHKPPKGAPPPIVL
jgi:hypothetical protein